MALDINKFDNGEKDLASIQEGAVGISAKDDTTKIDEYTDRFGNTRPTLPKVLGDGEAKFDASITQKEQEFYLQVQYKPSIPWAANTPVSDNTQIYSEGSDRYRPNPSKTPFTTGSTIADDIANNLWLVYGEATQDFVIEESKSAPGKYSNYRSPTVQDMVSGKTIDGSVIPHNLGQIWGVGNSIYKVKTTPVSSIDDFDTEGVSSIINTAKLSKIASATKSIENDEWYVDPINGIDAGIAGYTPQTPAKTIQFVLDSLPDNSSHEQLINVSAGVCNKSSRTPSSMPRAAIVYPQGKFIANRTAQDSGNLTGSIVIKGAGKGKTFIETSDGYDYGVYASGVEIALQDLTVRNGDGKETNALVTGHRGGYVHMLRVDVKGDNGSTNSSLGAVAESGGKIEMVTCTATGSNLDLLTYPLSFISFSGGSSGGSSQITGELSLVGSTLNGPCLIANNGTLVTQDSGNRSLISGLINIQGGGVLAASKTDITSAIISRFGDISFSQCGWSNQIVLDGGNLRLSASNSYVSPATKSDVGIPIAAPNNPSITKDDLTNIVNSSGVKWAEDYGRQLVQVTSNGFTIPITLSGLVSSMQIGASAAYTGCLIGDVTNVSAGTPPPDGAILNLYATGGNVQIINNSNASFPKGNITIGTQPDGLSGCQLIYDAGLSQWRVVSSGPSY